MRAKVVAIGIDAPNVDLLNVWLEKGYLPNIKRIADQGAIGRYAHSKKFRNERCWEIFLGAVKDAGSGSTFMPSTYDYFNESLQREDNYAPFYALGEDWKVCTFDLPGSPSSEVFGIQISGWGSEMNAFTSFSIPDGLLDELQEKYGTDPKLTDFIRVIDHKTKETERSYVLPSLYDQHATLNFKDKLLSAIRQRNKICKDLITRDEWDLFITVFPESHTANHVLWHLGESHPLSSTSENESHAMLEILQAIDHSIGEIAGASAENCNFVVFTIDSTTQNTMDVPTMALLPEFLYRWNFPGQTALCGQDMSQAVPPFRNDYSQHWKHEIWNMRTREGEAFLESPATQEANGSALSWSPANWYRRIWPQMRAFALPSVSDGYVRLNVCGRESNGLVDPNEFQNELANIRNHLSECINPRTGRPLVKKFVSIRETPFECPDIPPDLVICWDDESPADVLDSPLVGRIGPMPFFRSGGHVAHNTQIENTCFACGPNIIPGKSNHVGGLEDLGTTLLAIIGANSNGASPLVALHQQFEKRD